VIARALLLAITTIACAARVDAQSGDGSTAGTLLSIPAGSRAAAMGGAYVAGSDVDVLFYNPAGAARLGTTASMVVQRHVADMMYASLAASTMIGPAAIGVTVGYLDFGTIDEIEPDP
jgi:hypothetical protein